MKVYYTGAQKNTDEQRDPLQSLGGHHSATEVPNSQIGNIFPDLAWLDIQEQPRDCRCLVIHNESESALANFKLWIELPETNYIDIKIGLQALSNDACGDYAETILRSDALPYNVTFYPDIYTSGDALELTPFPASTKYALWLKRTIKDTLKDQFDSDTLNSNFENNIEWQKKFSFTIKMTWG